MRMSNLSDLDLDDDLYKALSEAKKHGEVIREFIRQEVYDRVIKEVYGALKDNVERDLRIYHLMAQVDSMEKSIKDTNKKITAIRNQLHKEKGRGDLS